MREAHGKNLLGKCLGEWPAYWGWPAWGNHGTELEEIILAWARTELEDLEHICLHRGLMRGSTNDKHSDGFALDWARKISRV